MWFNIVVYFPDHCLSVAVQEDPSAVIKTFAVNKIIVSFLMS